MYYQLHDLTTLTQPGLDSCLQNNEYLVNKICLKSKSIFCLFRTRDLRDTYQKVVELLNSNSYQKISTSFQFYAISKFQDGILYPVIYNGGFTHTFKPMKYNYSRYRKIFFKSYTYNPRRNVIEMVSRAYSFAVQDKFLELSTFDHIDFAQLIELTNTKVQELVDAYNSLIEPSFTEPLKVCQGCSNYHGKSYKGTQLICAIHPSGYNGESCLDYVS